MLPLAGGLFCAYAVAEALKDLPSLWAFVGTRFEKDMGVSSSVWENPPPAGGGIYYITRIPFLLAAKFVPPGFRWLYTVRCLQTGQREMGAKATPTGSVKYANYASNFAGCFECA